MWFFGVEANMCMFFIVYLYMYFGMLQCMRTVSQFVVICGNTIGACLCRDRMVGGFPTTCAISAYHHWCCELESRLERGLQHYVIKFASDLKQVGGFLRVLLFPPPIKLTATI